MIVQPVGHLEHWRIEDFSMTLGVYMRREMGLVGAFGIALVATATLMSAQLVVYEIDGWCLSYERDALSNGAEDVTIPGAFPAFEIPSVLRAMDRRQGPSTTGLTVRYSKSSPLNRPGRIEGDTNCSRVPDRAGLIRLTNEGSDSCRIQRDLTKYEAETDDEPFAAIRLSCFSDPAIFSCRLVDIYPTGWEAGIFLPKDEFDQWQAAVLEARAFFEGNLNDCGAEH